MERRTSEIYNCMMRYKKRKNLKVLDIGTADGGMMSQMTAKIPEANFIGIDLSPYLLTKALGKKLTVVSSDACKLPFNEATFDVITAAAVIEHFDNIEEAVGEIIRVLKISGLCVFTTPNPLHDYVASTLFPWYGKDHKKRLSLRVLKGIFLKHKLTPLVAEGFLFLPFSLPFTQSIEKFLKRMGLGFLLFNQIIAGQKQ